MNMSPLLSSPRFRAFVSTRKDSKNHQHSLDSTLAYLWTQPMEHTLDVDLTQPRHKSHIGILGDGVCNQSSICV